MRRHDEKRRGAAGVARVDDDAAVVVEAVADVVAIRVRSANLTRIRILELEGGIKKLFVVRQIPDILDLRLEVVAGIRSVPPEQWRGELGYLAAMSPTVHRLALELTDRQAAALAGAISDTTALTPGIARLYGIALAGVFQIIIDDAGRRTREGQTQAQIADELFPIVKSVLDELDRWLSAPGPSSALTSEKRKRARGKD